MSHVARRIARRLAASVAVASAFLAVRMNLSLLSEPSGTAGVDHGETAAYGRLGLIVLPVLAGLAWLAYDLLREPAQAPERGSRP